MAAGTAEAADVGPVFAPVPAPPVVAPAPFSWAGAYVGIHGGYSWGDSDASYDDPTYDGLAGPLDMSADGWFGGVQAGFNVQNNSPWVFGVEADVSIADIEDTIPDILAALDSRPGNTITGKTDYFGTVRGRVGYSFGNVLPYLTGGLAFAHTTVSATDGSLEDNDLLTGWTAGGGAEVALSEKLSFKGEYLYSSFGDHTWFAGDGWSSTASSTSSLFRLGANFHF